MVLRKPTLLTCMLVSVACLAAAGFLLAAEPPPGDSVPLYTNEDLLRLFGAPSPREEGPAPAAEERGWEFVADFLEREYALIEAEREHRLRRTLADAEAEALHEGGCRGELVLAAPFLVHSGFGRRSHFQPRSSIGSPRMGRTVGGRAGERVVPLHARPGGAVVPLHARPTLDAADR